jgi:hypothetical protein
LTTWLRWRTADYDAVRRTPKVPIVGLLISGVDGLEASKAGAIFLMRSKVGAMTHDEFNGHPRRQSKEPRPSNCVTQSDPLAIASVGNYCN